MTNTNYKTKPIAEGFQTAIMDMALNSDYAAFQVTLKYPERSGNLSPTTNMKISLRLFARKAIASHYERNRYANAFRAYCFIDFPGTRYAAAETIAPSARTADGLHHHCIFLAKPSLANKMHSRLQLPRPKPKDGGHIEKLVSIGKFDEQRACFIQRPVTIKDLVEVTGYATKSVDFAQRCMPDEAYQIITGSKDLH